jgi:hypothetical protein
MSPAVVAKPSKIIGPLTGTIEPTPISCARRNGQAKMPSAPVPDDRNEVQGFWSWKILPSLRASSRFPYSAAILRAFK